MANVLFKKGLLSQLPTGNNVVDGALYFAINDTTLGAEQRGKLYLGDADHNLIPIGEDIVLKTVANMEALPAASAHLGEFYYIRSKNILAFSETVEGQAKWVQVNNDTKLVTTAAALTTTVSSNTATVRLGIDDTSKAAGLETNLVSGSFSIKGGDNVTVSNDSGSIKIDAVDTKYTLGSAAAQKSVTVEGQSQTRNTAKINLTSSSGVAADNSSIEVYSANNTVTIGRENDGSINLEVNADNISGISSLTLGVGQLQNDGTPETGAAGTQGFNTKVTASDGNSYFDDIDPLIRIKNINGEYMSGVHFVSGTASLDVFSTTAVENLIAQAKQDVNAMTYVGAAQTLVDIEGTTSSPKALHNGDVFLATDQISFAGKTVTAASQTNRAEPGYLIIVSGTEENGVIPTENAQYTIVKANDNDTTYSLLTTGDHQVALRQTNGSGTNTIGSLTLATEANNPIQLTDTDAANNAKTITIKHANVDHTASTGAAQTISDSVSTFTVVTGVTVNDQGHVTNVQTSTLTPRDTIVHVNTNTYAVSAEGTNNIKIQNTIGDDHQVSKTDSFNMTSTGNTISITAGGAKAVNLDIVWGTF